MDFFSLTIIVPSGFTNGAVVGLSRTTRGVIEFGNLIYTVSLSGLLRYAAGISAVAKYAFSKYVHRPSDMKTVEISTVGEWV